MSPDVNVLVAASRSDHPHHAVALAWLVAALAESERGGRLTILPMVATGFIRLVTHPKVFVEPTPPVDAWRFLDALLAAPGVELVELGGEWQAFRRLCQAHDLAGNAVPDAWIAATVKSIGEHLDTFDRAFTRLLGKADLTVLRA